MTNLESRLRAALAMGGDGSSDFDLNPDVSLPADRKLRPAGVLVGITAYEATPHVVLTKRSSALKHHPGQIAFPGGKKDPSDADITATALREAREEIALPGSAVQVLGTLPSHETITCFDVTPVLAMITTPFDPRPEVGEVEEVFRVPLPHLTAAQHYIVQSRRWGGRRRRYSTVPYGPYYIWGATARILRGLAARLDQ